MVSPRSRAREVRGLCERTGSREVERRVGDVDGRHVERHTHERVSVRPRVDRVGESSERAGDAACHGITFGCAHGRPYASNAHHAVLGRSETAHTEDSVEQS